MAGAPEPTLIGQFRFTRGWLIRVLASAALLTVTLLMLPTEKVADSIAQLRWPLFLLILVLFLASHVVAAAKWWFLLGRGITLLSAVRAHFVGLAANLCLPGVAGGDVVRGALVMREMGNTSRLVTMSLADRIVDTAALGLLTGLGLLLIGEDLLEGIGLFSVSRTELLLIVGLPVVFGIAAGFLLLPWLARMLARMVGRKQVKGVLQSASVAISELAGRRGALLLALVVSFSIQAGLVMLAVILAAGVGVEAPLEIWFFAWPLAKILAIAPISLGGIGVREASLAALMAPFGADAAGVVAASLIWQGVLFAAGALGAAMWVFTSRNRARSTSAQPQS
jgi:uncharacterized protein (TIRG00374 family)